MISCAINARCSRADTVGIPKQRWQSVRYPLRERPLLIVGKRRAYVARGLEAAKKRKKKEESR